MKNIITLFICIVSSYVLLAQTPSFPGAEGGGMFTSGGRGGNVYYVTTLQDTLLGNKKTREGSLRWCLKGEEPKIILFKVAGLISLNSPLEILSNTTIAGQSAPGDGICISNYPVRIKGDNVIIRFMRFRMGDLAGVEDDALSGNRRKNIIIDHCSLSWSTDECGSFYNNENFTLQWCILSESLRASVHHKGKHGYGGIWGGTNASFHHNLLAHHDSRNPRMCGSRYSDRPDLELVDFRNNVIYNWGSNSGYAGEGGCYNIVNNYYKPTKTSANKNRIFSPNADAGDNKQAAGVWGQFYVSGNYIVKDKATTKNNILGVQPNPSTKNKEELISLVEFKDVTKVATDDAETAYAKVLAKSGASFRRDKTDTRVITEVRDGLTPIRASKAADTKPGMIDSQNDVGGWDTYTFNQQEVVVDSNLDGIPDGWLESNYPTKTANDTNEEGYTYLEVYLNNLIKDIIK